MAFDKNYIRLAQFYSSSASRNDIIREILKDKALNYQIPPNLGVAQTKLDLEGYTALHIALKVNDHETFKRLIRFVPDYTIKNGNDETVIHQALNMPVKNSKTILEMKSYLNNKFINSVLSAHMTHNNSTNPRNKSGISHFHVACMTCDAVAVPFFLKNGASVSEPINFDAPALPGFTPLHCAARYSSSAAARILLEHGAPVYCKDAKGLTPLHLLIERNMEIMDWINMGKRDQCRVLKYELQRNNNRTIERMYEKYSDGKYVIDEAQLSCLHIACTLQNTSLVKQLLEKNADLDRAIGTNAPLWAGYTALHFAAHFNVDTVKLLIKKGANMLAEDVNGMTPFNLCLQRYETEVVEFLIESQTNWRYIRFSDETFLSILVRAMDSKFILSIFLDSMMENINVTIPIDSPIWPGYTPLHLAVNFAGRYKEANEVNGACASEESTGLNKIYNCTEDEEQLYLERIKLMLEAGADVTIQDSYDSTPLHLAFLLQRDNVVNLLLQHHKNTNVNPIDDGNLSHLHIACAAGNHEVVVNLLVEGFDVNHPMAFNFEYKKTYHKDAKPAKFFFTAGSTPLHIAVIVRDAEMAETLMMFGADVYAKDDGGMTPIHRILAHDFHFRVVEIGRVLFSRREFYDCATEFGLTHLHVACHVNDVNAVERLLDLGADIGATVRYEKSIEDDRSLSFLSSYENYTPLDFAVRDNCLEAFDLLMQRGTADPLKSIRCDNFDNFLEKLNDLEMEDALANVFGERRLHKACFRFDVEEVEELLKIGADPNSKIPEDFKTFAGYTPLHILLRRRSDCLVEKIGTIIEWLIDHGADTTLTNAEGVTPVLAVFSSPWLPLVRTQFQNLLLDGHKDLAVNPANNDGISHFHVACLCNRVAMVESFLIQGIDVNQTVEPFSKLFGGLTPLHLAASSGSDKTVDLLLKYGANVDAQDCNGNTPLHHSVSWINSISAYINYNAFVYITKSLIRAGARMDVKNLAGEIPFEKIVSAYKLIVDQILEILPKSRCFVNIFSTKNDNGYIAAAIKNERKIKNIMNNPLFATVKNALVTNGFDEMSRTPIHNIVSIRKLKTPFKIYMKAIHAFVKLGIDIDHQNTYGETALHYAVKFQNGKAVAALLGLGADINKANINRGTAFSSCWSNFCTIEELDIPMGITQRILKKLWKHVYKLQLANLFVSSSNKKIEARVERRFYIMDTDVVQQCQVELERFESRKFDSTEITLHSFLFDTGAVTSYPHMLQKHRQAIDHLFQHRNFQLREEFPEFSGILQMQYKKALQRVDLIDASKSSLDLLTKYVLPALCGYHILKFLTNDDLKKLTALEKDIMEPPLKRRKLNQ